MTRLNKYIVGVIALATASAFIFSGCNKGINSADKLLEEMQKKASETSSFSTDVNLKLDMDYSVEGTDDNMVLVFDEYIDAVMESKEIYTEGVMKVADVYSEAWESYIVKEEDSYVSYSCLDGEWYYNDVDEENLVKGPFYLFDAISEIEDYTFKKDIDYVIEAKIGSEDILNILNCIYANVIDSAFSEGVDTTNMTGTVTVRMDIITCLPISMKIVFDDCSDMFVGEDMFDSASINEFVLDVAFDKYNKTEDISVPVNVADLFKLPEGDDIYDEPNEDVTDETKAPVFEDIDTNVAVDDEGYYELTDYEDNASIKVKAPEGYVLNNESDSAMLSFDKEGLPNNDYCTLIYEMAEISDNYSKEDIESYMEVYYNFYGTDDAYEQMEYIDNQTIDINGTEVNYSGLKYYYGGDEYYYGGYYNWYYYWVYIDEYVVICNVTDYSAEGFTDFDAASMAEHIFEYADIN